MQSEKQPISEDLSSQEEAILMERCANALFELKKLVHQKSGTELLKKAAELIKKAVDASFCMLFSIEENGFQPHWPSRRKIKYIPSTIELNGISKDKVSFPWKGKMQSQGAIGGIFSEDGTLKYFLYLENKKSSILSETAINWLETYLTFLTPYFVIKSVSEPITQKTLPENDNKNDLLEWKERLQIAFNTIERLEQKLENTRLELQKERNIDTESKELAKHYSKQLEENQLRVERLEKKLKLALQQRTSASDEYAKGQKNHQINQLEDENASLQEQVIEQERQLVGLNEKYQTLQKSFSEEKEHWKKKQYDEHEHFIKKTTNLERLISELKSKSGYSHKVEAETIQELERTVDQQKKQIADSEKAFKSEKEGLEKEFTLKLTTERNKVAQLEDEVNDLAKSVDSLKQESIKNEEKDLLLNQAQTCLEELATIKEKLEEDLGHKKRELEEKEVELHAIRLQLQTKEHLEAQLNKLEHQLEIYQQQEKVSLEEIESLKSENYSLAEVNREQKKKLEELELTATMLEEIKPLNLRLVQENKEISKELEKLKEQARIIDDLKKEVFEKEGQIEIISESIKELENLKIKSQQQTEHLLLYQKKLDDQEIEVSNLKREIQTLEEKAQTSQVEADSLRKEWYVYYEENARIRKEYELHINSLKKQKERLIEQINKLNFDLQQANQQLSSVRELEASLDSANRLISEQNGKLSQAEYELNDLKRRYTFNYQCQ